MATPGWDQSLFEETLQVYMRRVSDEKIPHALNKKMFFTSLRAQSETEKVALARINWELLQPILAKREDGSSGRIPVGIAIAARRAQKQWTPQAREKAGRGRRTKGGTGLQRAWRKLVQQKLGKMTRSRQRAVGFIRLGWLAAVKKLGPLIKDRSGAPSGDTSLRQRGSPKGDATPATASHHSATIINTAKAKSEELGGFERIGYEGLNRAFAAEAADMIQYLEKEAMKAETDRFNQANRR